MIKKSPHPSVPRKSEDDIEREFLQIKQALVQKAGLIETLVSQRFSSPKPWKFKSADVVLQETGDIIDLVFEHPVDDDKRYVLLDLSIPFLQKGQKFSLEIKAKEFQKANGIALARVKKAILLIRRPEETFSRPATRLHCPIIEMSLEALIPQVKAPVPEKRPESITPDLISDLKLAVVRECLTTMHKRRNKYIRKGLWRWIEREITDPNVHFFLIILSCIYQGEISELLSRQFKEIDHYCKGPDQLIEAIFSPEAALATEILRNTERHKKALRKFLECFSQTPPFEYLKSIFLKEFRTTRDSIQARLAVFNVLKELMVRCGFVGEKEINYPLEILDELGIFQGILMGDYTELRVENAVKKLRHLIPNVEWSSEDLYRLREELAKSLNLPPREFNLNAFLPQAFTGGSLAEKNASRAPRSYVSTSSEGSPRQSQNRMPEKIENPQPAPTAVIPEQRTFSSLENSPVSPDALNPPEPRSPAEHHSGQQPQRVPREHQNSPPMPVLAPTSQPASAPQPGGNSPQPTGMRPSAGPANQVSASGPRPQLQTQPSRFPPRGPLPPKGRLPEAELDESRHRFFESFGGCIGNDEDSVRMALEMDQSAIEAHRKSQIPAPVEVDISVPPTRETEFRQMTTRTNPAQVPSKPVDRPQNRIRRSKNPRNRPRGPRPNPMSGPPRPR